MNKKKHYVVIGSIICIFIILVNLNYMSYQLNLRYDATQDKLYTLSDGTKNIIKNIKHPITFRFYISNKDNRLPVQLKIYANRVENLLKEYVNLGKGKIILEQIDPEPDMETETSAFIDGIKAQSLANGGKYYFGLAISCLDKNAAIASLSPLNEKTIEYDITRSIYDVSTTKKIVLGILSSLPVMGGQSIFSTSKSPWIFVQELQKLYTVESIDYNARHIDDNIDLLIIVHPKKLSKETEFAIDQFLLAGRKLLVFTDPYCFADGVTSKERIFNNNIIPTDSTLPELFSAWGISFSKPNEVVIAPDDEYHSPQTVLGGEHPGILELSEKNISQSDITTTGLNKLNLVFAGAFKGNGAKGLKKTAILKTSPYSDLYLPFSYEVSVQELMDHFKTQGPLQLAIQLTGNFETAFPNTVIKTNKTEADFTIGNANHLLKKSIRPSSVILVGDVDMLFNSFCVAVQQTNNNVSATAINNNIDFILNAVDVLMGDENILTIRARGTKERHFGKIEKLYNKTKKKFESKTNQLNKQLEEIKNYLSEIQETKSNDKHIVLTSDQLAKVRSFKIKETETIRELKEVRTQFRNKIESLKIWLEVINIGLIPLCVIIFTLSLSTIKKMKRKKTNYE